jgi:hypothetical protein
MENLLRLGFILLFAAFGCGVCWLLATIGGWTALASHFRSAEPPQGKAFSMQSGRVGIVDYGSCLNIRVNEAGMYLAVFPLFRVGHPPLFIPWSEFGACQTRSKFFWTFVEVSIGKPYIARLCLPPRVFPAEILENGKSPMPIPN